MTEILLVIVYTLLLSYIIYRTKIFFLPGVKKKYILLAFIIKIIAGCALTLIYTFHYTDRSKADVYKFYDDSGVMMEALKVNPKHFFELFTGIGLEDPELYYYVNKMNHWATKDFFKSSHRMMIRMNTTFRLLTPPGEHYYLHVVFINFLSLLGLVFICKTFFLKLERHHKLFFLILLLFPSILFWGSGLLKDSIIIFLLGSMMYSCSRILNGSKYKWLNGFVFLISASLLALIKIYILFAMIPALAGWVWCSVNPSGVKIKFAVVHAAFVAMAIFLHFTSPKLDPVHYLTQKQKEFFHLVETEKPNHVIAISLIDNSMKNIFSESAPAFFRTLLRPHIFEAKEPLILISALENLFLIVFIFIVMITARSGAWNSSPLFYFSLSFFLFIFILVGLMVPVTGAIVRYKIVALPFLIYMLFCLFENSLLEKFLKRFGS